MGIDSKTYTNSCPLFHPLSKRLSLITIPEIETSTEVITILLIYKTLYTHRVVCYFYDIPSDVKFVFWFTFARWREVKVSWSCCQVHLEWEWNRTFSCNPVYRF